jgi:hypothetical protein
MKWLRRYLQEKEPTLENFAKVVRGLMRGRVVGLKDSHQSERGGGRE